LRATRVQAALTALVFVVSSWFGMVHEATTRHVQCAEHGELVDAPSTAAHRQSSRGAAVRDAGEPAAHGHEHCSLMSATRASRIAARPPTLHSALIAISEVATAPPGGGTARATHLYRTAPKTSPPV
jgi:hypothetical protein